MTVRTEEKQSSFFADTRLSTRKTQRRERVPWALASHAPRVQGACAAPRRCAARRPRAAGTLLEVLGVRKESGQQVKVHDIHLEQVAARAASQCQQSLETA